MKLMLTLQLVPVVNEKVLVQSAGVPEPGICTKFGGKLNPPSSAFNDWLPSSPP